MPIGAWAHIQYWAKGDGMLTPIRITKGGYPGWQASVIAGSLLGGFQGVWERVVWLWRWARRWYRLTPRQRAYLDAHVEALAALDGEQAAVLASVLTLVSDAPFIAAQASVRTTATTLGMNKPAAWVKLSHTLKERHDWAENSWRHLDAMRHLDAVYPALSNPQKNLLIELAYAGFAANPRGTLTRGD